MAVDNGRATAVWQTDNDTNERIFDIHVRRFRVRPGKRPLCGDAHAQDLHLEMRDALKILRSSADPNIQCIGCLCDTDGSGTVTSQDALRLMRKLLGVKGRLDCPPCAAGIDSPAGEPVLPPLQ